MRISTLLARNLVWYWRTNLAVLLGVATATGVLAGALQVGDSVRASLRDLVLGRLGNTVSIVTRDGFFRERLAGEIGNACPIVAIQGVAAHEPSGRRAGSVQLYGVDDRFWKFQGLPGEPPGGRDVLLSAALARELGGNPGDTILLRVEKPTAIPLESLHGRKEDVGKTMRLLMAGVMQRDFSLRAAQGDVRAVYAPLSRIQRELVQPGKANTLLVSDVPDLAGLVKRHFRLEDLGLRVRQLEEQGVSSLESDSSVISDALAETAAGAAKSLGLRTVPVLTYLANTMRAGARETPYSLVTALKADPAPETDEGITLNEWAARDLSAKVGDSLTLEYYVWRPDGLHTESAQFSVARIASISGAAADRNLAPEYPGITESDSLHDWDPPFPLDLSRVRRTDEDYWDRYRTTPKAFIRLARGRQIWGTRFGSLTSIRFAPRSPSLETALHDSIDPAKLGLASVPIRAESLAASHGATDFGEYFVYFSFFVMVSALLLTGLFFKLGVEQRLREIGVLRALGFDARRLRSLFLKEGAILAVAGAGIGIAAALGYGALILYGLRTWWVDAVGTRALTLHPSPAMLAAGALAGIVSGLATIAWTLWRSGAVTPRGLVLGDLGAQSGRWRMPAGVVLVLLGVVLVAVSWTGRLDPAAGFFGAGAFFLAGAVTLQSAWLRSRAFGTVRSRLSLGLRSATYRPGRSVLSISLIASATFLIVSLDAFRRAPSSEGAGGYPLVAESAVPLIHDPNSAEGRDTLNLTAIEGVRFVPFRLRPGDDASCLNLYQPQKPRILAPPASFLRDAHFRFDQSAVESANPWLLLEQPASGGAVPAIADSNSLAYVLHRKVGEEFTSDGIRFRIVAALHDSIFQSELLISETQFVRLFPDAAGFRFFLLNAPEAQSQDIAGRLEAALSDYGFDIQRSSDRLATFHRVENTYLSTFRALGGLGLALGTIGLAAIVLRNVLERRKELALLRAVGYRPGHLAAMVLAENLLLLILGLATGAACALVAVAPAVSQRGGQLPVLSLGALLAAVLVTGVAAAMLATIAALRSPLLDALRSE
jgi:ABC-type lipoprotein release transport system permease subunit